jgi:uncharacterized protein
MSVFVDTSALLAMLDADESSHRRCADAWTKLVSDDERLLTSSYVVVEVFALVQRRLGLDAVRELEMSVMPLVHVLWVDSEVHRRAISALLAAARKRLSLVDCASFELMRDHGIRRAFTLDRHFTEQGFEKVP